MNLVKKIGITIGIIAIYFLFAIVKGEIDRREYLEEHYAAQYEDLLFHMLDIESQEIEKIAISRRSLSSSAETAEEIKPVFDKRGKIDYPCGRG